MTQTKEKKEPDTKFDTTRIDEVASLEEKLLDKWLIRDCDLYKDEYKECTSAKGRFHQYFIYGETLDCNQWKKDYDNCCKWESSKDIKAAEAVINSEKLRRLQRLQAHYKNDTWKKRETPPNDWNKPLPEWMQTRDENTYLAQKLKEDADGTGEHNKSFCVIM